MTTALDLDIYIDYADESCSSRWDTQPPPNPSRRIILSHPDGVKSPGLGGPPSYHPTAMSHSERDLFVQRPLYAAPLSYYAIKALKPWFYNIGAAEQLLSSQPSVSATRGNERANLGKIIAPWAQWNISRLDPLTWAFLIQNYHDLPNHYSQYQIALNDPNLPALSALPSTPRFSIVTVLDLSKCADLHDTNITQLKVLSSLCVLDTSNTGLTDQGVKNLKSTLLTSEPGPLHLRSWNLRGCIGITNRVLESLAAFPLLCVLADLRATSVRPLKLGLPLIWDSASLLSPKDHAECFWPHPQVRLPVLLQTLGSFVFRHSAKHPNTVREIEEPYVVHVNRQAPRQLERPTSSFGTTTISRLNRKTYLVNDSYGQPVEETSRAVHAKNRESATYSYENYDSDCYSYSGSYENSGDEHTGYNNSISGSDEEQDNTREDSASEDSLADFEVTNTDPSVNIAHDQVSSPRDIPSALDSDEDLFTPEQSTVANSQSPERHLIIPRSQPSDGSTSSVRRNSISTTFSQDTQQDPVDSSWTDHIVQEQLRSEPGVSGFYNARAQAGLAPPKRKRHAEDSSQGYSSEAEVQTLSGAELILMLIRKPPPWSTAELLAASVSRKPPSHQQVKPEPSIISSTKKRKVDPKGATALWAHIKASSNKLGEGSHQPNTSKMLMTSNMPPKPSSQSIQASHRAVVTGPSNAVPVRRTPLGRAPRAPGAIIPKRK